VVAKFKNRRIPVVASVLAVGIGLTTVGPQTAPVQAAHVSKAQAASASVGKALEGTVTLVTGDRVKVTERGRKVEFLPAAGRPEGAFLASRQGGRLTVVPADVAGQVSSGGWIDDYSTSPGC